jgi:hypothetical protein
MLHQDLASVKVGWSYRGPMPQLIGAAYPLKMLVSTQ